MLYDKARQREKYARTATFFSLCFVPVHVYRTIVLRIKYNWFQQPPPYPLLWRQQEVARQYASLNTSVGVSILLCPPYL